MSNICLNGSLKGRLSVGQGERGLDGKDGKSAYELWLENGNEGTVDDFLLSLKGKDGEQGIQGLQGEKGDKGDTGLQGLPGQDGKDGITPNIQIGTVTTLEPNQQATVTRRGDNENPIFDFGIPKGADGTGGGSGGSSIDDATISTDSTWSSSKIEDFVLTNDDVVWTEVNGENLSIDYTKKGYLREIEIWGNTIQNEEDLSDIQHLGELYVDDEGGPILDELGREQYKIEIESCNKNLIIEDFVEGWINTNTGEISTSTNKIATSSLVKVLPNTSYGFTRGSGSRTLRANFNKNKEYLGYESGDTFTTSNETHYIRFFVDGTVEKTGHSLIINGTNKEIYVSPQSHKTTILLPCQLMKVGDVADRLYWDSEKNKYVVEKYINTTNLLNINNVSSYIDGSRGCAFRTVVPSSSWKNVFQGIGLKGANYWEAFHFGLNKPMMLIPDTKVISSYANTYFLGSLEGKIFSLSNQDTNSVVIFARDTNCFDTNEMNDWIKSLNGKEVYYTLLEPQLIETNITEQIILPTYADKTHIFVSGGIDGSIKCKAPLDGGQAILSLSQENKELQSVNQEQDELINISLLATDEIFMMIEPLLINTYNVGGNDKMVDLYVVMVQRGIKKIEDVPVRYREQVIEILNKLED